ncbi:MAG TPA: peptidoglycan-binding protein [Thermohalobaculum sp.]|nr:peptidoglycan-binding protein [Thermohalobaculum sp.]
MLPIDGDLLWTIAPRFSGAKADRQREILDAVGPVLRPTLAEYDIDSALRIGHFVAQVAHESAGFRTTEEFASGAAYEGRADLGNTQPGDGKLFKGRGLIQLTGRANYKTFGRRMGVDLVSDPEAAAEPVLSLRIACEYWKDRRINQWADRDNLVRVTKKINGGTNGLEDRRQYLAKAKNALAHLGGTALAAGTPAASQPVLRRGSQGQAVVDLQEALSDKGVPVTVDGIFGAGTETAVKVWQKQAKLDADGIVGPATWASLGR